MSMSAKQLTQHYSRRQALHSNLKLARRNIALYVFLLPAVIYLILFNYAPMYGIQIAFRNFTFADGITGSKWVGLKWFNYFFKAKNFGMILGNTIKISLYSLVAGFPFPILLALMLHNVPSVGFKKTVQTVTYLPHFISTVVIVGMISCFFSYNSGFINTMVEAITGTRVNFMGTPKYFIHLYVWSGVWQGAGWGSIIYMAALTGISPELHEAAMIDGATKLQRILHVDLPGIMPTMIILLIMRSGSIMSVGFEKVYLMQNSLNSSVSEVIATYTYKQGMQSTKYSYSAAVGLFNNVINFVFLTLVNEICKRLGETSLW